jgi:hypothetical protein
MSGQRHTDRHTARETSILGIKGDALVSNNRGSALRFLRSRSPNGRMKAFSKQ